MSWRLDDVALLIAVIASAGVFLVGSVALWPQKTAREAGDPPSRAKTSVIVTTLRMLIDSAGYSRVSVGAFVIGSVCLGVLGGLLVLALSPIPILALCAAVLSMATPTVVLIHRRARRQRARAVLWPDVADTLVSLVRSGVSLVDAVSQLGATMPASVGGAALKFAQRVSTSAHVDRCLDELKADWADPAGDRIVEALKLTRDVGGTKLTTVLRELSIGLRRNLALRREVEARQSWIRVAAGIGAAAPWIVVLLLSTRTEAATAYSSAAGTALILGGLTLSVVAYQIMTRIGRLPAERRWLS